MENGQKKLKELFDGRKIFIIPDYQRSYAWDKSRQLPEFLEDIKNQSVDRDYFLGTILFRERPEKEAGFDLIDIVDGQQRVTTIIIFMKSIIEILQNRMSSSEFEDQGLDLIEETYIKYKERPKLRAISPDDDFFQVYIIGNGNGLGSIDTPSQRRLYEAKKYFLDALKDETNEELLTLKRKLDEKSKVLTYSVKDESEATLIFETTNDRGKSLTNLEKIKSFLMYKIYLSNIDETDQYLKSIQTRFSDIFKEIELFENNLSEDTVLQYHFIAFEKWTEKTDYQQPIIYIKSKLNKMIRQNQNRETASYINDFSISLKETFRILRDVTCHTSENYRNLVCLQRLGSFYPLLIKSYKFDATENKSKFDIVCKYLEILSFRVLALGGSRSDAGQTELHKLAREFSGKYEKLYDSLANEINRLSSRKSFESALRNTELYSLAKSNDISYLMWKYENHLRDNEQPICSNMSEEEFLNGAAKKRLTIEHIASQKSNSIIENRDVLTNLNEADLISNLHRLGNLTFDPASSNSSKGNSSIEIKNSRYFTKAPYKTQNELEAFLIDGKWTIESMEQREEKIVRFCLKNWSPDYAQDE